MKILKKSTKYTVDRFLFQLNQFLHAESMSGIILLICTIVAVIWANSPWLEHYHNLWKTLITIKIGDLVISKDITHWINEGLMAIFFLVVGLEIKRELLVGELSKLKKALFPFAAAFGGALVPALLFVAFNLGTENIDGWGIPTATDIAFALGILYLFGKSIPKTLTIFLMALAIIDDILAVVIIAVFYSSNISTDWLLIGSAFFTLLMITNLIGVQNIIVYALLGLGLWFAMLESGVHSTLAGVLLAVTIPAKNKINLFQFVDVSEKIIKSMTAETPLDKPLLINYEQKSNIGRLEDKCHQFLPPLVRLEQSLHPWVAYIIMPLFAFANAGVTINSSIIEAITNPVFIGIVAGLVVGKQVGVLLLSYIFDKLKIAAKPKELNWKHIHLAGCLAGIGFTMSLFIADLAFDGPEYANILNYSKLGIITASLLAGLMAFIVFKLIPKKEMNNQ